MRALAMKASDGASCAPGEGLTISKSGAEPSKRNAFSARSASSCSESPSICPSFMERRSVSRSARTALVLLARAESFASLNPVIPSVLDGIGIGLGFTFSLTLLGFIRELMGAGSIFGYELGFLVEAGLPMTVFILPAGGFMVYGFMMVIFNAVVKTVENKLAARKAAAAGGDE